MLELKQYIYNRKKSTQWMGDRFDLIIPPNLLLSSKMAGIHER